jgi:predicted dehydrogenase
MLWSGVIGDVTEVHAWTNRPAWPQGIKEAPAASSVPAGLDWDLWLGVAKDRPFSEDYLPFSWRGFFDFGSGALGDMACHILGASNMALRLTSPTTVECLSQEDTTSTYFPSKSVVRFDFPARGAMPPVSIFWYDGMREDFPTFANAPTGQILGDLPRGRAREHMVSAMQPKENQIQGGVFDSDTFFNAAPEEPRPQSHAARELPTDPHARKEAEWMRLINTGTNGSLFKGSKGMMTTGTYGEWTRLLPVEQMRDYEFPKEFLSRSPGHYRDWIRACKGGEPACSNFNVSAPFTEWIALGAIATRLNTKIEWDAEKMRITNNSEANELLKPVMRKGWKIG